MSGVGALRGAALGEGIRALMVATLDMSLRWVTEGGDLPIRGCPVPGVLGGTMRSWILGLCLGVS